MISEERAVSRIIVRRCASVLAGMDLSDGTCLIGTYSWAVSPLPRGFPVDGGRSFASTFEGLWTLRSTDGGATWSERKPVRVSGLPPLSARCPPIEMPDHSLLMA